jgi:hypothetical protein
MSAQKQIEQAIERKIEDYHRRFLSPTPATVNVWRRQLAAKLSNKNQLSFDFMQEEPKQ